MHQTRQYVALVLAGLLTGCTSRATQRDVDAFCAEHAFVPISVREVIGKYVNSFGDGASRYTITLFPDSTVLFERWFHFQLDPEPCRGVRGIYQVEGDSLFIAFDYFDVVYKTFARHMATVPFGHYAGLTLLSLDKDYGRCKFLAANNHLYIVAPSSVDFFLRSQESVSSLLDLSDTRTQGGEFLFVRVTN